MPLAVEEWEDRIKRLPALRDLVAHHLDLTWDRQAKYYNRHRRDIRYSVVDIVWWRTHVLSSAVDYIARKLSPKYAGPFKVIKVISPVVYEIQDESGIIEKAHVKDLKHYWSVDPDLVNNELSFQPSSKEESARLPSFDGTGYSGPEGSGPSATGAKTPSEGLSPHSVVSGRRGRPQNQRNPKGERTSPQYHPRCPNCPSAPEKGPRKAKGEEEPSPRWPPLGRRGKGAGRRRPPEKFPPPRTSSRRSLNLGTGSPR